MRHSVLSAGPGLAILLCGLAWTGCTPMSESVDVPGAGLNGGFEHVESGLPVNWLVYSPETVGTGSFRLGFDTSDPPEGRQALKFSVDDCAPDGGRHSPGIAQELPATPGTSYRIGFWIRSAGCSYVVVAGGVDAKSGDYETLDSASGNTFGWKRVERLVTVPEGFDRLRFELSIRSAGELWIDDVRIDPVAGAVASGDV